MDRPTHKTLLEQKLEDLLLHRSGKNSFPWYDKITISVTLESSIKTKFFLTEEDILSDLITQSNMEIIGHAEDYQFLRLSLEDVLGQGWNKLTIRSVRSNLSDFSQGHFRIHTKPSKAVVALNKLLLMANVAPMMQRYTYELPRNFN